jgi:hypothetical protein
MAQEGCFVNGSRVRRGSPDTGSSIKTDLTETAASVLVRHKAAAMQQDIAPCELAKHLLSQKSFKWSGIRGQLASGDVIFWGQWIRWIIFRPREERKEDADFVLRPQSFGH